jgi:DEAD/DEAH box helicase domain-containing protein
MPNECNQRPVGPTFLACSATMSHPEHHFRLLCPLPPGCKVTIVKEDGSPRSSKHFFVWNPPLLDIAGNTTGLVQYQTKRKTKQNEQHFKEPATDDFSTKTLDDQTRGALWDVGNNASTPKDGTNITLCSGISKHEKIRRRHSADETALLLARAVTCGVRCIAFCKSRCLVEWVYEKAIAALQRDPNTAHLTSQVQSYRGGYTQKERRRIEEQLFQNKLLAVVGTSALELVSHRSVRFLVAIRTNSCMQQV